jgi:cobalamin biosynthesis protein CobD/CbiB
MDLGKFMSRGVADFFFHPLTFRNRLNNFIGQQVYSRVDQSQPVKSGMACLLQIFIVTLIFSCQT